MVRSMKVYVLSEEPYHDNSGVLGAFSSVESAIDAAPSDLQWRREGFYCTNWPCVVAETRDDDRGSAYLIREFDLDVMPEILRSP